MSKDHAAMNRASARFAEKAARNAELVKELMAEFATFIDFVQALDVEFSDREEEVAAIAAVSRARNFVSERMTEVSP